MWHENSIYIFIGVHFEMRKKIYTPQTLLARNSRNDLLPSYKSHPFWAISLVTDWSLGERYGQSADSKAHNSFVNSPRAFRIPDRQCNHQPPWRFDGMFCCRAITASVDAIFHGDRALCPAAQQGCYKIYPGQQLSSHLFKQPWYVARSYH